MAIRLEILYDDDSVELINPTVMSEIAGVRKTGVLAMALWQSEGQGNPKKRINYGYRDEKDNYSVIVDPVLGFIIVDAWDDGDRIVIRAQTPEASDGYPKPDMPLGFHNIQSANSMNFHFLGALVDPQKWIDTQPLRDAMNSNTRDV